MWDIRCSYRQFKEYSYVLNFRHIFYESVRYTMVCVPILCAPKPLLIKKKYLTVICRYYLGIFMKLNLSFFREKKPHSNPFGRTFRFLTQFNMGLVDRFHISVCCHTVEEVWYLSFPSTPVKLKWHWLTTKVLTRF